MTIHKDPICGMDVREDDPGAIHEEGGQTTYFCAEGCKQTWLKRRSQQPVSIGRLRSDGHEHDMAGQLHPDTRETDPVCGMTVDPENAAGTFDHDGVTYYFCSTHCLEKFKDSPDAYLGDKKETEEDLPQDVEYTCPMHPEIVQIGPGSCPICGMALEPKVATLDEGPDP